LETLKPFFLVIFGSVTFREISLRVISESRGKKGKQEEKSGDKEGSLKAGEAKVKKEARKGQQSQTKTKRRAKEGKG